MLYWSIGREIMEQQRTGGWGDDVVGPIARDLAADTGSHRGVLTPQRVLHAAIRRAMARPGESAISGGTNHLDGTSVLMDRFSEDPTLYAWCAAKSVANRWSVRRRSKSPKTCPRISLSSRRFGPD